MKTEIVVYKPNGLPLKSMYHVKHYGVEGTVLTVTYSEGVQTFTIKTSLPFAITNESDE
jgi:hypothetical protein